MANKKETGIEGGKVYTIYGVVLCVLGVVWVLFAITHPELSFPWPGWVSGTIYGLYICYTALIFCMPRLKGASAISCAILAVEFAALGLIIISIGIRKTTDSNNWYLPAGLFLSAAGNFAGVFRKKLEQKKSDRNNPEKL